MSKRRVGAILKEAIHVRNSPHKNKDLDTLIVHYHELQKKLKTLVVDLKSEHQTMVKFHEARAKVATQIAHLTAGTPIDEGEEGKTYSSVHKELATKSHDRAVEFQKKVIDYVTEWDSVVSTRVDAGIKKSVALRRDLDHYDSKVDHLKHSKIPDEDKLGRNADKHTHASDAYETFVVDMCILLEEVTDRSWKDFIPLLARMATWDKKTTDEETVCLAQMDEVVEKLAAVAATYNMEGSHEVDTPRFQRLAYDEPASLLSPQAQPKFETPVKKADDGDATTPQVKKADNGDATTPPVKEEPGDDAKGISVSSDGDKDEAASE